MEYYDPIDHTSRRYAAIATAAVLAVCGLVMWLGEVAVHPVERPMPPYEIIFEALTEEVEESRMHTAPTPSRDVRYDVRPAHVEEARSESSVENSGEAEKTQTLNPNALFKPTVGNVDETVAAGNRLAPDGDKESSRGSGAGYNLQGSDQLDAGLRGRGLREALPRPQANFQSEGTVVVSVVIDGEGNVTSATIRQQGTTTNDTELRNKALAAARKAKFRPSDRLSQGGTITYVFTLK